jgi:hypothetical protein
MKEIFYLYTIALYEQHTCLFVGRGLWGNQWVGVGVERLALENVRWGICNKVSH